MTARLTVEELAATLDETLRRVERGERFVVDLDGTPAAIILSPADPLRDMLAPQFRDELGSV